MRYRKSIFLAYLFVLILVPFLMLAVSRGYSLYRSVSVSGRAPSTIIVLDPGHGGEDGGALSCTGVRESVINLQISLRLNDILGLLGIPTKMTRDTDISLHSPDAGTVSEKKVSDLHNRVKMVEQTPGAILVSIHQNMYAESKYHGAQVFCAETAGSQSLAEELQEALRRDLDPGNHRQVKKSLSVYLLKHISCPAVLIECGFLSNPAEEARLRDPAYQLRLACSVASCLCKAVSEASPA